MYGSHQSLTSVAKTALDSADAWFESRNISLPPQLSIRYIDKPCPFLPQAAALYSMGIEESLKTGGVMGAAIMQSTYDKFGIQIKVADVLEEHIEVMRKRLREQHAEWFSFDENSIILLPLSKVAMKRGRLAELMAHERWHHIEDTAGYLVNEGTSHEGTATYVQNRYAGRSCAVPQGQLTFYGTLYARAAQLVEEVVGGEENDISSLLREETHAQIVDVCYAVLRPELLLSIKYSINQLLYDMRSQMRENLLTLDCYRPFREFPSHDTMLQSLRLQGLLRTADLLSTQDTSALIRYNQVLLEEE